MNSGRGLPDVEIIAVGSELLTPSKLDTNSLWLTERVNALGLEVVRKSVVGDDRERLEAAIRAAFGLRKIILLTGGLGPTEDDVTRDAAAAALGRSLSLRADIVDWIERRFARFGRKMAEINKRQAYVIEGAEVLPNPNGTAPGQWIEQDGMRVALMPGPPGELKPMFEAEIAPRIQAGLEPAAIRSLVYRVVGIGESDLDHLIAPVYTKYSNPVTTILAAVNDVQVHLRARCATAEEAEALAAEVGRKIEPLLGDKIYSRDGSPLEVVVGRMLHEREATVAVAESCTGGMLGERITSVPGSSDYFAGGFLVYTNVMKTALLGVDPELLEKHTAVSNPVARAMADGVRERTGSTYALSVTGIAGPEGGTEEMPVGTGFIGISGPNGTDARKFRWVGDRRRIRQAAVQSALDLLRRRMIF
jgi:competence/damage-inducible protein CinA-like protein